MWSPATAACANAGDSRIFGDVIRVQLLIVSSQLGVAKTAAHPPRGDRSPALPRGVDTVGFKDTPLGYSGNWVVDRMENTELTYRVAGMNCDHCRVAVTDEVSKVAGVRAVDVDLEAKLV